jgi:hypothetical protein
MTFLDVSFLLLFFGAYAGLTLPLRVLIPLVVERGRPER